MDTEVAVAVAAAVVVVLLIVAWLVARQRRRRAEVREHFGPEYDRALEAHGDRRAAEKDLDERRQRREELDIRPLPVDARIRYADEWHAIQARFVDTPQGAIKEADILLDRVMRDRGYPVDDFGTKADLLSVDHPVVLQNYRSARAVQERNAAGEATTEDLRDAMLRYRSLFDELLEGER